MVEDLGELDERHLAMLTCRFDDLTAEGLTKAMGANVLYVKVILSTHGLEVAVDHLRGDNVAMAVEEAELAHAPNVKGLIAVAYMLLEGGVDLYLAALARLLLDDRETRTAKKLSPCQALQVGDAQPEEAAAADKEREAIVFVVVQLVNKVEHLAPLDVIGCSVTIL